MTARRKKKRTHVPVEEDEFAKVPKSFVIKSGQVGVSGTQLVRDVRKVMEPNTASHLRERKTNKLKDFVHIASQFHVSHFMIFSQTTVGTNLRIARIPHGPTLTFRVANYSLVKDIAAIQKKPHSPGAEFHVSPLLVLNNFGGDQKQIKLVATVFQNLFPAINVQTMKLADARRVVLINYNSSSKSFELRHYLITVRVTGVSKSVRRIITNAAIPDLSNVSDISDYILSQANVSESEAEEEAKVELSEKFVGRNNGKNEQRAIKLVELGPRMDMNLLKIESGLCEGEVIHHSYVKKSATEARAQDAAHQRKITDKAQRRAEQEANVKRKIDEKDAERERQRALMKSRAREQGGEVGEDEEDEAMKDGDENSGADDEEEEEDDEEDQVESPRKRQKLSTSVPFRGSARGSTRGSARGSSSMSRGSSRGSSRGGSSRGSSRGRGRGSSGRGSGRGGARGSRDSKPRNPHKSGIRSK